MIRRCAYALSLAALLLAAVRTPRVHAHAQQFTISVGRNGFENTVDYTLDVEAGHEVTLTFTYADGDLADDNEHDIKIKGPGLDDLPVVHVSRDQPTATVTFVPKKSGTLHIVCTVPCAGMENLAGGTIKVVKPKATGAPVTLTLDLKPRENGGVLARVTLLDAGGNPLADQPVIFSLRTSLGGDLMLGAPTTIENGSAALKIPATASERLRVTAAFEGGNGLAYTEATSEITVPGLPMQHLPGPLSTATAPPTLALALLVVLGGVWATYGFVVYQVVRIRRSP